MYLTDFFLNQYFFTQGLGIWREGDYAYIISKTSKDFYWSGRKLSINYDREQSSKLTAAIEKNILILCIMYWVALEVINTVKCRKTGKRFDSYAIYRLKGTFFCYFFFHTTNGSLSMNRPQFKTKPDFQAQIFLLLWACCDHYVHSPNSSNHMNLVNKSNQDSYLSFWLCHRHNKLWHRQLINYLNYLQYK